MEKPDELFVHGSAVEPWTKAILSTSAMWLLERANRR
jgi:hypothetical protein